MRLTPPRGTSQPGLSSSSQALARTTGFRRLAAKGLFRLHQFWQRTLTGHPQKADRLWLNQSLRHSAPSLPEGFLAKSFPAGQHMQLPSANHHWLQTDINGKWIRPTAVFDPNALPAGHKNFLGYEHVHIPIQGLSLQRNENGQFELIENPNGYVTVEVNIGKSHFPLGIQAIKGSICIQDHRTGERFELKGVKPSLGGLNLGKIYQRRRDRNASAKMSLFDDAGKAIFQSKKFSIQITDDPHNKIRVVEVKVTGKNTLNLKIPIEHYLSYGDAFTDPRKDLRRAREIACYRDLDVSQATLELNGKDVMKTNPSIKTFPWSDSTMGSPHSEHSWDWYKAYGQTNDGKDVRLIIEGMHSLSIGAKQPQPAQVILFVDGKLHRLTMNVSVDYDTDDPFGSKKNWTITATDSLGNSITVTATPFRTKNGMPLSHNKSVNIPTLINLRLHSNEAHTNIQTQLQTGETIEATGTAYLESAGTTRTVNGSYKNDDKDRPWLVDIPIHHVPMGAKLSDLKEDHRNHIDNVTPPTLALSPLPFDVGNWSGIFRYALALGADILQDLQQLPMAWKAPLDMARPLERKAYDKAALGKPWWNGTYKNISGRLRIKRPLNAKIYLPNEQDHPKPKGGYPVVYLFHGGAYLMGGRDSAHNKVYAAELLAQGAAVITFDWPTAKQIGFYQAVRFEDKLMGFVDLTTRDLITKMDQVNGKDGPLNLNNPTFLGFSAGGQVAYYLAGKWQSKGDPKRQVKQVVAMKSPTGSAQVPLGLKESLLSAFVLPAQMDHFKGPVTLVYGDQDDIIPLSVGAHLAAARIKLGLQTLFLSLSENHGGSYNRPHHPLNTWLAELIAQRIKT